MREPIGVRIAFDGLVVRKPEISAVA